MQGSPYALHPNLSDTESPNMRRFLFLALAALMSPALASADEITGTVTYRERLMMPPDAVLEVQMQDTSLADAPAETLATYRVENPGAPPYDFAFTYDPAAIDAARSYTLRATIHRGDRLMMTTDTVYPVLTQGGGTHADMLLKMVASTASATPDAAFVDTYWKILTLPGTDVTLGENQREPHIILRSDGSYNATVGCNMIRGGHSVEGTNVTFKPGATTLMACPPPLDTMERSLVQVLSEASAFDIEGEAMTLLDAAGAPLATFTAVYF